MLLSASSQSKMLSPKVLHKADVPLNLLKPMLATRGLYCENAELLH